MTDLHIWVGYDPREPLSYKTCVHSIREVASPGVTIHKLDTMELRQKGLFSREWKINAEGQYLDILDGKPFSTWFAYTRFLVPYLARKIGAKHALFMDSDMVMFSDPALLLSQINSSAGVSVVKHDFSDPNPRKMDGMMQTNYRRKLWSAFMVFDTFNPYCQDLTPDEVNTRPGSFLHQLDWMPDSMIGSLEHGWQYIPGHSDSYDGALHCMHFTQGTPEMPKYVNAKGNEVWLKAFLRASQN